MDYSLVNILQHVQEGSTDIDPEEFLFKNHPDLEKGGIVHQAHTPSNVILVWWFNPLTAEFIKSSDPKHLHMDDYRSHPYLVGAKEWVRGRVFKSGSSVFLLIYNLKGMRDVARLDLLMKISEAIDPVVISAILTPEGQDISNLFEGTYYILTPSKLGYWQAKEGSLVETAKENIQ